MTVVLPQPGGPVKSTCFLACPMSLPSGSNPSPCRPDLPNSVLDFAERPLRPVASQQLDEHVDGFLPGLAGVLEMALPEVFPPPRRFRFRAGVFGGPAGFPFNYQATAVIGLLIDPPDLAGDLAHVLLGSHAVAGRLVELHGDA